MSIALVTVSFSRKRRQAAALHEEREYAAPRTISTPLGALAPLRRI
ncbi:MAG: hypothetical protein HOI66_02220 [Verrucomicrobia bacterium]|nr:hypothetical protein [Verrucomicrobiota bacterium]